MNRWIIEKQIVGRLSNEDWAIVCRRVKRLNSRILYTRGWARNTGTRILFTLMCLVPLASILLFKELGINAAPGFSMVFIGVLTACLNAPTRYLRSIRRLRVTRRTLALKSKSSYRQLIEVYGSRSLGIRLAAFGAVILFVFIAPPGTLGSFLGISAWDFVTPMVVSILGLALLMFPVLPFARLWQTSTMEALIASRRQRPAALNLPPSCLACAHPTLTGPLERCAECGYPNILPPGIIPPTPKSSVDVDEP